MVVLFKKAGVLVWLFYLIVGTLCVAWFSNRVFRVVACLTVYCAYVSLHYLSVYVTRRFAGDFGECPLYGHCDDYRYVTHGVGYRVFVCAAGIACFFRV